MSQINQNVAARSPVFTVKILELPAVFVKMYVPNPDMSQIV